MFISFRCETCCKKFDDNFVVHIGKKRLCHKCVRRSEHYEKYTKDNLSLAGVEVPDFLKLMIKREMGHCPQKVKESVNVVVGMQFRNKLLQQSQISYSQLLDYDEILVCRATDEETKDHDAHYVKIARKLLKDIGINTNKVQSATRVIIPLDKKIIISTSRDFFPTDPSKVENFLIRMRPDWRNHARPDFDLGPNDIYLLGIPDALISDESSDITLVCSMAKGAGVDLKSDMFQTVRSKQSGRRYGDSILIVQFKSHDMKETIASAFRNCVDLFERAPYVFTTLTTKYHEGHDSDSAGQDSDADLSDQEDDFGNSLKDAIYFGGLYVANYKTKTCFLFPGKDPEPDDYDSQDDYPEDVLYDEGDI